MIIQEFSTKQKIEKIILNLKNIFIKWTKENRLRNKNSGRVEEAERCWQANKMVKSELRS